MTVDKSLGSQQQPPSAAPADKATFERLCKALPEGVSWGDPLTYDIALAIVAAQPSPAPALPPADESQMPLPVSLRLLASQIKENDGLRDNRERKHRLLERAADALEGVVAALPAEVERLAAVVREGLREGGDAINPGAMYALKRLAALAASQAAPQLQSAPQPLTPSSILAGYRSVPAASSPLGDFSNGVRFAERQHEIGLHPSSTESAPQPTAPSVEQPSAKALGLFTEWLAKSYPGPDTIIHDPYVHAPSIFRAASWAIREAAAQPKQEQAGETS